MRVINKKTKKVVVQKLEKATTVWKRLKGLLGRKSLPKGHGLLILRSGNSIHTFFMKFSIDLVFINRKGVVKHIANSVKPWRIVFAPVFGRTDCLELPAGTVKAAGVKLGDILSVEA